MNPGERPQDSHQPEHIEQKGIQKLERSPEQPAVALCRRLDEILAEAFRQAHDQPQLRRIPPATEQEFWFKQGPVRSEPGLPAPQ